MFVQLTYARPATIQRYVWVGGDDDGIVVALMLTHFGPSSQAPFAKLIVKEAGRSIPLFVDSAYKMSGGETELAELCSYLLNKNADKLKDFGIKLSNNFLSEANSVVPLHQKPYVASGWVDLENIGFKKFLVKGNKSDNCPKDSVGIATTIEFDGIDRITSTPSPEECWNDSFLLRNIFRTRKALWFIMNMHAIGLANEDIYWIDVQGITL